ncbi:hypothetical protein MMC27_000574, partial [Xylographa pallens]|nr:hypothetical protein [Xylographa pallens]
ICIDYAIATEVIASECMVAPFVGAVLAIIGVVVMIILSLIHTQTKDPPADTPVDTLLKMIGAGWDEAPSLALAYAASASERANNAETYQIGVTSVTPNAVTVISTTITVGFGPDAASFFSDSALTLTTDDSTTKTSAHSIYPAPSTLCTATMTPNILSSTATSHDTVIGGIKDLKANRLGNSSSSHGNRFACA